MKSNETQSTGKSFEQVFNRKRERVRGLWLRNGVYHAQVWLTDTAKQVPLYKIKDGVEHAVETLPEAIDAQQVLKAKIKAGTYPPKTAAVTGHTLAEAVAGYQKTRDTLHTVTEDTAAREDSCLSLWTSFSGTRGIYEVDSQLVLEHAENRLETKRKLRMERVAAKLAAKAAQAAGQPKPRRSPKKQKPKVFKEMKDVCGRSKDVDVLVLGKVLDWARVHKWIEHVPELEWKKLAKTPKEARLMTLAEMEQFADACLVTDGELEKLPEKVRNLRKLQGARAKAFSDYIRLIWFCGAREEETTMLRWSYVTWSTGPTPAERGNLFLPGANAKHGGGHEPPDRRVDLNDNLEAHLRDMYDRRDKSSDWIFPSQYDPQQHIGSFRKQLEHAREASGQMHVGFHFGRHFFISNMVAQKVDVKTIALWVGHADGGKLILGKYSHKMPGLGSVEAARVKFS